MSDGFSSGTEFRVGIGRQVLMPDRTLLVVTQEDLLSETVVYAIQHAYPLIAVEQVDNLQDACGRFSAPVRLMLLDSNLMAEFDLLEREIRLAHPHVAVAIAQESSSAPLDFREITPSRSIRGILPMDMKFDVWLSVIGLMLKGGEYYPTTGFVRWRQETPVRQNEDAKGGCDQKFRLLTSREKEILTMVARGLQNKIIAADLKLSEHTVKIHLHNILRKLGVHNRTEAAALFHDAVESRPAADYAQGGGLRRDYWSQRRPNEVR